MKLWLARQHDGTYTLVRYKPDWCKIRGTRHYDFYVQKGEPVDIRHLCSDGVTGAGFDLPVGGVVRVEMTIKKIAKSRRDKKETDL